jgi:phospholipid/cholesterol/gamma-HCH transport system substrate-binding protein
VALFRRKTGRRSEGMGRFRAGLIAIIVIVVFSYFGFTKSNPFANPFEFKAVFANTDNVAPGAPVRIAGVDVGKVSKIEPLEGDQQGGRVTMQIKDKGLPIHTDAEVKVQPRIFLEGNKFVSIKPGSPGAPELGRGDTIPIPQTSASVTFGDILTALQSDTRKDLQILLKEFAKGLQGRGAIGFRQAIRYWTPAYKYTSLANDATLGEEPTKDVQRVLKGQQRTAAALVEDEGALKGLVTNLNITAGAFARQDVALEASVPLLRDTLRTALPTLRSVNNALPSVRAFAVDALPGTKSSLPTITKSLPFLHQARLLVRRSELRGAAKVLRQFTPTLVRFQSTTIPVLEEGRTLSACTNNVLVPFANAPIPWPEFPGMNNQPFKLQGPRGLAGLPGESRLSDANLSFFHGAAVRPPGAGNTAADGVQIRPAPPPASKGSGRQPPAHRPDVPCETQDPPNLNAPGGPIATIASRSPRQRFNPAAAQRAAAVLRADLPRLRKMRGFTIGPVTPAMRRQILANAKKLQAAEQRRRRGAKR